MDEQAPDLLQSDLESRDSLIEIAGEDDDPYDQTGAVVLRDSKAPTSYIQRRLGIGYNRAGSMVERMENEGLVGPVNHAGRRAIYAAERPHGHYSYS